MANRRRERPVNGALTDREAEVLQAVADGMTHSEIAARINRSRQYISDVASNAMAKMDAANAANAAYVWGQYQALVDAAEFLNAGKLARPVDKAEEHVNRTLEGAAQLLRSRAGKLLPR